MNETYRNIAVVIEIGNSIKYLRNGLAEIQKISAANDFYDPLLMYLSSGFERIFKSMLCLNFKQKTGRLPNYKELMQGNNGHDIEYLKNQIEKICIPVDRPFASMDYDIITKDEIINSICKTLSEYGRRARYFNLDAILGTEQEFEAQKEWERIETHVLKDFFGERNFFKMLSNPKKIEKLYLKSNELLVSKLELFLRAITRQFIFGNFSSESNAYLFEIEAFSDIEDSQIGKTDYRQFQNHEKIKRL
ncbi:hypothetical protein GQR60_19950 [Labilibaculum sp. A4]|uniref:hypothetical protein n=1 Tax=Labilibaculum euxinus TaxID=2686357 RepID=UPI000F6240BB|nr:hypothetical protein [Labilibaculum euxinus]MDQ1773062.1 hypothetical protein [Labilibaculum euxinus]MWN78605.1 hypothetical protein [Labilibaculum euxinus]